MGKYLKHYTQEVNIIWKKIYKKKQRVSWMKRNEMRKLIYCTYQTRYERVRVNYFTLINEI